MGFLCLMSRIWLMELRRQAHSVYRCQYHLIWIPKFRYEVLVRGVADYLKIKLLEVRKYHPEIEYLETNIQRDHLHLLVSFPPRYSISRVVQLIKQNTGRALIQKFDFLKERYPGLSTIWTRGYFASTVGLDERTIKAYIKYQQTEDTGQSQLKLRLSQT